jgi:hypothetical protein
LKTLLIKIHIYKNIRQTRNYTSFSRINVGWSINDFYSRVRIYMREINTIIDVLNTSVKIAGCNSPSLQYFILSRANVPIIEKARLISHSKDARSHVLLLAWKIKNNTSEHWMLLSQKILLSQILATDCILIKTEIYRY